MIDHISVAVKNFEESRNFYDQTLAILGYKRVLNFADDIQEWAGYGVNELPSFEICIKKNIIDTTEYIGKAAGFHVGFVAPNVNSVHQWYKKCLELGGTDNGTPGPRPEYHPNYYSAFIVDPNGWRIEACFQNYRSSIAL